jgi:hypothetical protein
MPKAENKLVKAEVFNTSKIHNYAMADVQNQK